jgi:hypothetical protein
MTPVQTIAVLVLLAAVACLTTWLPARRRTRARAQMDATALRQALALHAGLPVRYPSPEQIARCQVIAHGAALHDEAAGFLPAMSPAERAAWDGVSHAVNPRSQSDGN